MDKALNVTGFPSHTGLAEAEILTLTGSHGLTVRVIPAEVAGLPEVQLRLDVSVQVTTSLFTGVYENVPMFEPMFALFTFH